MVVRLTGGAPYGVFFLALTALYGCSTGEPRTPQGGGAARVSLPATDGGGTHPAPPGRIPAPVTAYLPKPEQQAQGERYTVVANQLPVRELLFALVRDAPLNVDIVGDIHGLVTLNAFAQTLPEILDRIAQQVPLRHELRGHTLVISADDPYLRSYAIDYLNLTRRATSSVDLATRVGSISLNPGSSATGGGGNNSQARVENVSENQFWDSLVRNIRSILGAGEVNEQVIVHRESGIISIRATMRQHREVQALLEKIITSARRQVLIEATVVEITLSDLYQAGVDWRILSNAGEGLDITQSPTGVAASASSPNFLISYVNPASSAGDVLATLQLLNRFGRVHILSRPKIIALHNQAAVLKVVDNRVYFTVDVERQAAASERAGSTTFETRVRTVPVGFVMNLTPFINEQNEVILNVRPTISRILGFVNDPNPDLADAGVVNRIPEIQVREMESMLRVGSGQMAIIGGLMQDRVNRETVGVPGLSRLPLIGTLFSYQSQEVIKTELLVFLRPTVIENSRADRALQEFGKASPGRGGESLQGDSLGN